MKEVEPMKWEYKVLKINTTGFMGGKFDDEALTREMNDLGRDNWELVSGFDTKMGQGATRNIVLIFKRSF
jgi:hypothetical protein